jgi:DNA mismatch repair ATPase MutS
MNYILFGITALLFLVLFAFLDARKKKKQIIKTLKDNWGKEKTEVINFDKASWYSTYAKEQAFHVLSHQTMADIDFDQLFAKIDRTTSKIGQQFLYNKLAKPTNSIEELKKLKDQANFFSADQAIRERIQAELVKLNSNDSYAVVLLLNNKLVEKPSWFKWLSIDLLILAALLILSIKVSIFLILALLLITFNATYLNYWNKKHLLIFTKSLSQLNILIEVSRKLVREKIPFEAEKIKNAIPIFKKFQSKIGILYQDFSQSNQNDLSQIALYVFEIIKAIFLIEIFTFFKLIKLIENYQEDILNLYQYVGSIDTAISVASLQESEQICEPQFIQPYKGVQFKGIKHPLIENCIDNEVKLDQKSMLITGSNMSGKSTFLRTIAINSVLAQTIYSCFAEEYKAPFFRLHTSIRIDDNLFQGKSYFLEEVDVMSSLIDAVESPDQNLFILDEVFKGTNTIERIAAAKAILSHLNRKQNLTFVATHDIELSNMLEEEYELYHFTETITDNELIFDHKLKEGPLKTKNAIKILKISKYPKEIIEEALQISKDLSSSHH